MKILTWIEAFWPHIGGAEVFAAHLMSALREQYGYHSHIVTSYSEYVRAEVEEYDGFPLHRFRFKDAVESQDLKQIVGIRNQIADYKRQLQPDLVHIHLYGPSPFFHWITNSAYPAPSLVTLHSNTQEFYNLDANSGFTKSIIKADWFNTVSAFQLKTVREHFPEVTERSSVIYNGISMPAIEPEPLPRSPIRLLCLGRLVEWKGFDNALTSFARLRPEFPDLELTIAGDGEDRERLESIAGELGVSEFVDFVGWVQPNSVWEVMNQHSIVLMPSRSDENLPVVSTQAGQVARPVVAFDVSGYPEIIDDGNTGLLAVPGDVESFTAAIRQLLTDMDRAQEMGRNAQRRMGEMFSIKKCAEEYHTVYQKLIKDFGANGAS